MAEDEDDYFLPLEDQRVFGAGIKRKRVAFVPVSTADPFVSDSTTTQVKNAGDRYLSIVLPQDAETKASSHTLNSSSDSQDLTDRDEPPLCPVCQQPFLGPDPTPGSTAPLHESSITHQLCLSHSHPPSHLPRAHVGLKYLSSYGWDPDSRTGLGARGEGIRIPIKGKVKNDTVGIGVDLTAAAATTKKKKGGKQKKKEGDGVVVRLNAKEVRRQGEEGRRRAERLREKFYGRDLEEYLGPGG